MSLSFVLLEELFVFALAAGRALVLVLVVRLNVSSCRTTVVVCINKNRTKTARLCCQKVCLPCEYLDAHQAEESA